MAVHRTRTVGRPQGRLRARPDRTSVERGTGLGNALEGDGRPVILTGVVPAWPAFRKWTFEFFRRRFGRESIVVADDASSPKRFQKMTVADYLDYVEHPTEDEKPWYLCYWRPFARFPALLKDFKEPAFLDNWFRRLRPPMDAWYLDGFAWIFIGAKGAVTSPHRDLFATHAWLGQIAGRKRFTFYPPSGARPLDVVVGPGDFIVTPYRWMHSAVSLEPTISVTFNFVNETNFGDWILGAHKDAALWAKKFP